MKVLLALDNSQELADCIYDFLASHSFKPGTEFVLVNIIENCLPAAVGALTPVMVLELNQDLCRESERLLRGFALKLRDLLHSPNIRELSRAGSAGPCILALADEEKPDLIVLGSHMRKGLSRAFLGSVSAYVCAAAKCSVLVVAGGKKDEKHRSLGQSTNMKMEEAKI